MEVFATFNIYNSTGHRVAEGHKASFCLEDNQCMPGVQPRYACANFGDQGMSKNHISPFLSLTLILLYEHNSFRFVRHFKMLNNTSKTV